MPANNVCTCSANVTGAAAAVRSEKLQMLEQKLYKAQEELMEFHRKKGEVSVELSPNLLHTKCCIIFFCCFKKSDLVAGYGTRQTFVYLSHSGFVLELVVMWIFIYNMLLALYKINACL